MVEITSSLDDEKLGDLNYIKTMALDVLENYRDSDGDPVLFLAAMENEFECCKEIYRRCPSQLYITNSNGNTILHYISYYNDGMIHMLDFFVQAAAKSNPDLESGDNLGFKKWMELQNKDKKTAMRYGFDNCKIAKWWIKASRDYNLSILRMTDNQKNTPLHLAVKNQDLELVELLLAAEPEFDYTANEDGMTPLLIAMAKALGSHNKTSVAIKTVILERQPKQYMVQTGEKGWTSLHSAAYNGELDVISDIIRLCPDCTKLLDNEGQNFLHVAVKLEKFDVVKHVLRENKVEAGVWNQNDSNFKSPFQMINQERNTLLHLAVGNQDLELVRMLIAVGPDVVYNPNDAQDTPLDIAMRQALSAVEHDLVEIRRLLIAKLPSLCTVRKGFQRWTALHTAAHFGDVGAVEDILQFCPNCVELVDTEGRNFLHIAAEYKQFSVVKCALETQGIVDNILNQSDNRGNTPLHTAALSGVKNATESLLYDSRVDKTSTNASGLKVLDAITFDFDKKRAGVSGVRDRMNEKELKDQSDFDLVVCALIATVSFTAGITVPGGYITDGPDSGMALLSKRPSFEAFAISNNFALVLSLYAVFSHFCTRRLLRREDIIYQLNVATYCTLAAIFAMMIAFITGSYAVLAVSSRLAITVCVNTSCFFLFAFRALWKMTMQENYPAPSNYFGFPLTTPIKQV